MIYNQPTVTQKERNSSLHKYHHNQVPFIGMSTKVMLSKQLMNFHHVITVYIVCTHSIHEYPLQICINCPKKDNTDMCIIDVLYNNHKDGQSTCNLVVEIKIVALNHSIHKLPTLKRLRNQHQSVKMAKHMNCDASDYSAKLNHISHVLATTDDENYSCATVISAGLTVLNNSIILTMTKS